MESENDDSGRPGTMTIVAGALSAAIGLAGVLGWHLHIVALVRLHPSVAAMQYNTALGLLLAGVALLLTAFGWWRLGLAAAAVIAVFGVLTLGEYLFGVNLGIDRFLSNPDPALLNSYGGRMAARTAACFSLAGLALLLMNVPGRPRRRSLVLGVLAAALVALALASVLSGLLGIGKGQQVAQLSHMAVQASIGFVIIGLAMLGSASITRPLQRAGQARWIPLAAGIALVTVTLVFWQALMARERTLIEQTIASEAGGIRDLVMTQMESRILSLIRMGHRWDIQGKPREEYWREEARLFVGHNPGYQALEWVDPSFHVRWIVPPAGNSADQDLDLGADAERRAQLEQARDNREIIVTRSVDFQQGGKGFLIYVPIAKGEEFLGFLRAVYRMDELFDNLLQQEVARNYSIAIFDGGTEVYRSRGASRGPEKDWAADLRIELFRVPWLLRVWPKPELLSRLGSDLDDAVLAAGLVMALLLTAALYLAQAARRHARGLEAANQELQHEIAERKRAEAQIEERTTYLNALIEKSPVAIVVTDAQARTQLCNPAFERLFLCRQAEVIGVPLDDVITSGGNAAEAAEYTRRVMAAGESIHATARRYRTDGRPVEVEIHGVPLIVQGQFKGSYALYQDITERKRAEEALAQERDLLRALMDNIPDRIFFKDAASRFTRINRAHARAFGLENPEEALGKTDFDFFPAELAEGFYDDEQQIARSGAPLIDKLQKTQRPDEPTRWSSVTKAPILDAAGRAVGIVGISRDITERIAAEDALRDSEAELRALFAAMTDVILVLDSKGRYIKIAPTNPALLYQPPDGLLGKTLYDVFPLEQADDFLLQIRQAIEGQKTINLEYSLPINGKETWFTAWVSPIMSDTVIWVARDITEHRQLEEQYRQARRMEAVGRLAGGIAHDFNNLLTIIKGYSDLLSAQLGPQDRSRKGVEEISKAADRAASLTRQLLAFSRRQVLQPKVLDLNTVVANTEKMLRRLIGEDVNLITCLAKDLGSVKADPGQIEQVIMNLAVNARDAMPNGGTLTIETSSVELDEGYARMRPGVTPGQYVMLAVSDTGCGMAPEVQAQIFEPFFTTKEMGKGTGLGLATVYGIVKQSGGNIWVYSEPGKGSSFKIYLPRVEQQPATAVIGEERPAPLRGSETILLVEDEKMVRSLVCDILSRNGYTVLEASNGAETIRIAEQHQGPIHLLVTDVVMPGMSGRELAERLTRSRPGIGVLYMSGYTDDAIVRHGVLNPGTAFLQKPFTADALARKVREVLQAP